VGWMSAADFEARYAEHPDPWGYTHSDYERRKYDATLAACGSGPFESALELGASIGVFSALLAPRCVDLVTIDGAPTAVAAARRRLASFPDVKAILGPIPGSVPERPFDLVVASEILYYLTPEELSGTLSVLERRMIKGARLVAVHWRPAGPERPLDAAQVHELLRRQPWLAPVSSGDTDEYLLAVMRRR
jgi:cyclopropane fatty-acyl-phospholipid synthase-like methyltransferase